MIIIGVDYHPSFQQIAFMDEKTGEYGERQLNHSNGEAEKFYRELQHRGVHARVGMEATGHALWLERLLAELGVELWIGDPAEIKTKRVRKKKTDREDARLMLRLLLENRFPKIWVPSPENRDLRQLLWHRHRLVQMRTRIMNQLQAVAMNEGYRWKKKLFSEKEKAVQRKGTRPARETLVGSLGQSASQRTIGAAGPAGSKDCGVNGSGRARSQKTARGAAINDASWGGTPHGVGLRSRHWNAGAVSLWQADRQLHRARSVRGLQCRPATAGTYQQAGQFSTPLFAGGSIPSSRTVQPGLATSVCAPKDAPGKKNCQSGHGQKTCCSVVLDVAKQLAIFAVG